MATQENGAITFSYGASTLFNDVCLISAFMTKDLVNESGSATDSFIITEDEKDLFDLCVKQALPKIYDELIKMTVCTSGFSNTTTNISISVRDNGSYNSNVLPLVETSIYDCIKYGVLTEFYSICTNAALFGIVNGKYNETLRLLNQRLYQLKKRSVSSLY